MLPNNVVSFMKKMVKNSDTGQQENTMVSTNKLTRLKQTLTTGFQQAQDSVAKFSPKSIHVGVGDNTSRQLSSNDIASEIVTTASSDHLDQDALNPKNPQSALLNIAVGTKNCSGPPNRLTSCRVCVRSLSLRNSDVSFRLCSQCNLKVCEDCASYSDMDNDIEKTFWRCSVCRRRNQGTASPMFSSQGIAGTALARQKPSTLIAHRWSEEKTNSLSVSSDDYNKRSKEPSNQIAPGSAPVSRRERRSTSGGSGFSTDQKYLVNVQPMLQAESFNHVQGKSIEQSHIISDKGNRQRIPDRSPTHLNHPQEIVRSISASESSPEEITESVKQYERGIVISRKSASDIHFSESSSRRSSCRRSFQNPTRDQSVYLSADDASLSRLNQQRRYSSESSDASDASGTGTQRRTSQEENEESGYYGASLLPSTRRRLSFRSNRNCHFYDIDGTEGYDADEQSAETITPFPTANVSVDRSSRRSCSDISQLSNSNALVTTVKATSDHRSQSTRGSCMNDGVNDEHIKLNRKISTQLSDPPASHIRSQSPRPSVAFSRSGSDRRSIEREAIRIVIDDVDCPLSCQAVPQAKHDKTSSTLTVCLLRDPNFTGHSFTAGFGLSLMSKKNVIINKIDSNGPAEQAGLLCGDIVLSWDGVQLVGWNFEFEDIEEELKHSGDSIQIQVLRESFDEGSSLSHAKQPNAYEHREESSMRPNKLTTSPIVLDVVSSGRSTPPSPTRRRLPKAPTGLTKASTESLVPFVYRVQLQFNCSIESNGNVCMVITVIEAEKSITTTKQSHEIEENNKENDFFWIKIILKLPSGASRKFVTDRVEYSYGIHWNSFFTCSDLTAEDVSRSQFYLSLWSDYIQKGETKIAETNVDFQNITMDGRPTWFLLRHCDPSIFTSRRLCKAISYDQQNQPQIHNLSRKNSELSVDHASQSPTSSQQRTPSPPSICLPRSRSAEICQLLLQPEAPSWAMSGLSAPASLAPSRRGSSYNCDEELPVQHSSPSSRRGSCVFSNVNEIDNMEVVYQKLCPSTAQNIDPSTLQHSRLPMSQWRSQSFRTETKHNQHHSQNLTSKRIGRILNSSALEFGVGQILPAGQAILDRDETILRSKIESCGQIKLGLILAQEQLEVEVIAARNLPIVGKHGTQPDTYVKVTVCNADHVFDTRKTRTMRQTCHPEFHQTLLLNTCNDKNATMIIEIKLKDGISSGKPISSSSALSPTHSANHISSQENPSILGVVHIALNRVTLTTLTISWYRLIPSCMVHSTNINQRNNSP